MHMTFSDYIICSVVLLSPFQCYSLDQDFQFVYVNFVELLVPTTLSLIEKACGT